MARSPKPIGDVLAELMARRGFARVQATAALEAAWREAAGALIAEHTRVGAVKRGKLEIIVANSILLQELGYQKADLLAALAKELPDENIQDIRFRVGSV